MHRRCFLMPKYKIFRFSRKFFLSLFALILIWMYPQPVKLHNLDFFYSGTVLLYVDRLPQNFKGSFINNGINYEIKTDKQNAENLLNDFNVKYQTIIFEGNIDFVLQYLNIKNSKTEEIEKGRLITGYSHIIKGNTLNNGINIQVYVKDRKIYIGNPTIFGSY